MSVRRSCSLQEEPLPSGYTYENRKSRRMGILFTASGHTSNIVLCLVRSVRTIKAPRATYHSFTWYSDVGSQKEETEAHRSKEHPCKPVDHHHISRVYAIDRCQITSPLNHHRLVFKVLYSAQIKCSSRTPRRLFRNMAILRCRRGTVGNRGEKKTEAEPVSKRE